MSQILPELPEVLLVWVQGLVPPGPGVPPAVSDPHIITGVRQNEPQTGAGRVGDPVAARRQKAVLQEDRRPRTCKEPEGTTSGNERR